MRVKGPSERYSKTQLTEMKTDLLRDAAKKWRIPVAAKKPTDLVRLIFKAQQAADGKQSSADRKSKDELRSSKRKQAPVVELDVDDDDSDIEIEEAPVATKKKVVKKSAPAPVKATKKAPPAAAKKAAKKVVDEDDDEDDDQELETILQSWLPEVSVLLVKLADYADDTEVGPTIKKIAKLAQAANGGEAEEEEEEEESEEEEEEDEESDESEEDEEDDSEEEEEEEEAPKAKTKSKKAAKKVVDEDEDEEDEEEDDAAEPVTFDMKEIAAAKHSRLVEIGNFVNGEVEGADIDTTTKDTKALRGQIVKTIKENGEKVVEEEEEDLEGAGAPDWVKKGVRCKVKFQGEWYTGKVSSVGEESVMFLFDEDDAEAEYDFDAIVPLKKKAG